MAEQVSLSLNLDVAAANRAVAGLEKSFAALKTVAAAAVAAFAGAKMVGFLEDGIKAAADQEKALAKLANQLTLTGGSSANALNEFKAFADQMEKTTIYGDDLILSQVALAKSFGTTDAQAKKMVQAATELSAVTGKDLQSSVQALGMTLSGVTGKLDEQIPALKGLTKEQLASGAALDIIINRFGGSAQAEIQTFSGSITQLNNSFGNLAEAFGEIIVQNPVVVAVIQKVTDLFSTLSEIVSANGDGIRKGLNTAIVESLKVLASLTPALTFVVDLFQMVFQTITTLGGAFLQLASSVTSLSGISDFLKLFALGVTTVVQTVVDALGVMAAAFEAAFNAIGVKVPDALTKISDLSVKIGDVEQAIIGANIPAGLDAATQSMANFAEAGNAAFGNIKSGITSAGSGISSFADKLGKMGSTTAAPSFVAGGAGPTPRTAEGAPSTMGTDIAAAVSTNLTKGAAGASGLMSAAAAGAANLMIPGLGAAVGPLVDALGKGPDAIKGMVNGFADALPGLLDNIIDGIPVFIEAIADRLPDIIVAIVNAIPRIVVAFVTAFTNPALYIKIAEGLASAAFAGLKYQLTNFTSNITNFVGKLVAFDKQIRENISNFFSGIWDKLRNMDAQIREGIINALKGAFDKAIQLDAKFRDAAKAFIMTLVEKAQEFIDKIKSAFETKSSEGTAVGKVGKFGTDVYKAITGTAQDIGEGFGSFGLTGGQSPGSGETTQALLLQIIDLLEKPQTVNVSATVREGTLADIILNLSRRNARLTA